MRFNDGQIGISILGFHIASPYDVKSRLMVYMQFILSIKKMCHYKTFVIILFFFFSHCVNNIFFFIVIIVWHMLIIRRFLEPPAKSSGHNVHMHAYK